jgi:hypothetical protein
MESLIMRALAKAPADRPASMKQVGSELSHLAGDVDRSFHFAPASAPTRVSQAGRAPITTLGGASGQMSDPGKRRGGGAKVALLSCAAMVLVGGAAIALKLTFSSKPTAAVAPPPVEHASDPPTPAPAPTPAATAPAKNDTEPTTRKKLPVALRTEPPGARVIIAGVEVGVTPLLLDLALPAEVEFTLRGYQSRREVLVGAGDATHVVLKALKNGKSAAPPPPAVHHEGLD